MTRTPHRIRRTLGALGVAAVALIGTVDAAGAAKPPAFGLSAGGTHVVTEDGSAQVTNSGTAYLRKKAVAGVEVSATLTADDGTLPEPGVCEPATATMTVTKDGAVLASLVGTGNVCGQWIQPPTYFTTHVFTGRYEVVDGNKSIVGTDGWFSVRLGDGGTAGTEAYDT